MKHFDPHRSPFGIVEDTKTLHQSVREQEHLVLELRTSNVGMTGVAKGIEAGVVQREVLPVLAHARIDAEELDPGTLRIAVEEVVCP